MTPDAEPQWRGLDPALLTLRRWECAVAAAVVTVVAGVFLGRAVGVLGVVLAAAGGAAVLLGGLRAVARRFAAWSYAEREDDLLLRRGVVVQRTSVVPYGRMQYVDVTAGPLDRRFGLATVVLHTAAAATDATIPGLRTAEAARLRDRLAALGEARAAGV
ncbi:MAG TPA: PH domain-containing protein [Mycobacteriales bacterium]|nr:PH domain-containing protein [Mycobacteriales bacterium]